MGCDLRATPMNRIFGFAAWPFVQFTRFTQVVVGDITWRPPGWAGAVKAGVGRRPILSGLALLVAVLLVAGGGWLWNWYAHLPKPLAVDWAINQAAPSDPDTEFHQQPLTLAFDQSVAQLEKIGKGRDAAGDAFTEDGREVALVGRHAVVF